VHFSLIWDTRLCPHLAVTILVIDLAEISWRVDHKRVVAVKETLSHPPLLKAQLT
jgi:hypothetical protein